MGDMPIYVFKRSLPAVTAAELEIKVKDIRKKFSTRMEQHGSLILLRGNKYSNVKQAYLWLMEETVGLWLPGIRAFFFEGSEC